MPLRLTATIIGGKGGGVDGLDVELIAGRPTSGASKRGRACGHGCYTATLPVRAPTRFAVNISGAGAFRSVAFPLPGPWAPKPGAAFLSRATRTFRALRSVLFVERLSSGLGHTVVTTWKLEAPNKLEYSIRDGAGGIVIGGKRWDREKPGAAWKESTSTMLPQPVSPWGARVANAYVLRTTPTRVTLSWYDPGVPCVVHRHVRPRNSTADRAANDGDRTLHAAPLPRLQPRRADRAADLGAAKRGH